MKYSNLRKLGLLVTSFLISATPSFAQNTYYVGSCYNGGLPTINAAIATAPAGSVINVCPGEYPEQVVINKALSLQGMPVFGGLFDSGRAVITVPDTGLSLWGENTWRSLAVAPQVVVKAGSVNISNITVDGTATPGVNCPPVDDFFPAIWYISGSSGVVTEVVTRNQNCNGAGIGILAENGAGLKQSVTIQNSNVSTTSWQGILVCSNQMPSTLAVTIRGNYISGPSVGINIDCNTAGTVSGNVVSGASLGIAANSSATVTGNTVVDADSGIYVVGATTVSGNTVNNASYGVFVSAPATVTSNRILNSRASGVYLTSNGATVTNNTLVSTAIGIDFQCHTATATGNTINGATTGLNQVLTLPGVNTFFNVDTLRTGC